MLIHVLLGLYSLRVNLTKPFYCVKMQNRLVFSVYVTGEKYPKTPPMRTGTEYCINALAMPGDKLRKILKMKEKNSFLCQSTHFLILWQVSLTALIPSRPLTSQTLAWASSDGAGAKDASGPQICPILEEGWLSRSWQRAGGSRKRWQPAGVNTLGPCIREAATAARRTIKTVRHRNLESVLKREAGLKRIKYTLHSILYRVKR